MISARGLKIWDNQVIMDPEVFEDQSGVGLETTVEEMTAEIEAASHNGHDNGGFEVEQNRVGENIRTLEELHAGMADMEYGRREIIERSRETLDADAGYLEYLRNCDQNYIDKELIEKGQIIKSGAAVLSLDIEGYSTIASEIMKKHDDGAYGAGDAADETAARIEAIADEVRDAVRMFDGKLDQFLGDGINTMFADDDVATNVTRAQRAAELLQTKFDKSGFTVRIGIDVGDVELVVYGDKIKLADMRGMAVERAVVVQKTASVENGYIAISQEAQAILERAHKNGGNGKKETSWEEVLPTLALDATVEDSPEDIADAIKARESVFSKKHADELRDAYLGHKPKRDTVPVSTILIRLPELQSYEERNQILSEIFETGANYRAKNDKVRGDEVMINFVAWLNDTNAVKAGQRLVEELRAKEIDFKMGLARAVSLSHSVGGLATVSGDGPIRVRRILDSDIPKNCLVMDRFTWDRVKNVNVTADEMEAVVAKGFEKPIERYVVKEVGAETATPQGRELVYRDAELQALETRFEQSKTEKVVQLIAGAKGLGKSALANEFANRKQESGANIVRAKAEIYNQNQPFLVWRNVLEKQLHLETKKGESRAEAIHDFFQNNLPELSSRIALLNPILNTRFEESDAIKYLEADERDEKRADFLKDILETMTGADSDAQGMIVVEDLQFMDEESEKLLASVINKWGNKGMFVLTSWAKDMEDVESMPRASFVDKVGLEIQKTELSGLPILMADYETARESGELEEWWGKYGAVWFDAMASFIDLDKTDFDNNPAGYKRIITKLSQKTGGNLLYIGSALHHLTIYQGDRYGYFTQDEAGKFRLGDERIQDRAFDKIPDIDKIEQARLEMVDSETQNLIKDAAVVGAVFDADTLAYVSGKHTRVVERKLQEALGKGIILDIGDGRYQFVDTSMANAVYNSIGRGQEKQRKHRMLGEYFEIESPDDLALLVRHFRNGDDYIKALNYLDKYSESLREDSLWGPALNHVNYATKIFETMKDNGWVIPDVKKAGTTRELSPEEVHELVHGQVERTIQSISSMVSSKADWSMVCESIVKARKLFMTSHNREALSDEDRVMLARLHIEQGTAYRVSKNTNKGVYELAAAKKLLSAVRDDSPMAADKKFTENLARCRYDVLYLEGRTLIRHQHFSEALQFHIQAERVALDGRSLIAALESQGFCYRQIGQIEDSKRAYTRALNVAETSKDKAAIVFVLNSFGEFFVGQGDLKKSEQMYYRAMHLAGEIGRTNSEHISIAQLSFIERINQRHDQAVQLATKAINFFDRIHNVSLVNKMRAERAFNRIKIDDWESAKEDIEYLRNKSYEDVFVARSMILDALLDVSVNKKLNVDSLDMFQKGVYQLSQIEKQESEQAFALYALGECLLEQEHHFPLSESLLRQAAQLYRKVGIKVYDERIQYLLAVAQAKK